MVFISAEHARRVPRDQRVASDVTSSTTTTLHDTVTTALALLGDLSDPHDAVRDGRLEIWLGTALRTAEAHDPRGEADGVARALPAVRTASAHLAAGGLEDTYLALLSARDLLRSR